MKKKAVIVTDPPFNIGYKYLDYKDRMKEDDYYKMLSELFEYHIPVVLVHYPESMHKVSIKVGEAPEKVVSWVYNSNTRKQHRDIAFYRIVPDFSKVTQPYKNPNDKRVKKLIEKGRKGAKLYDWWNINQIKNVSKEKTEHPCQMPLEVMERVIKLLPEDIVIIDPFAGSGTTLLAAKNCGHEYVGIEISEQYCQICKERLNLV
jgi:DNA modification methylase